MANVLAVLRASTKQRKSKSIRFHSHRSKGHRTAIGQTTSLYVFSNTYKLYKTENIYIFLRLNTSNGKIDQVQWNLDRDKEFITVLNDVDLTYGISIGNHNGRFELYPTQNMYQFLLLDTNFGSMWHVQWGLDSKKRWIVPIN